MEKLILKCGRYLPPAVEDTESRIRLLETYLAALSGELEFLVEELDVVLSAWKNATEQVLNPDAVSAAADGKEDAYE